MKRILFILILTSLNCCKSMQNEKDSNHNIKNDSINLYAFIGEKISISEFDPNINNATIEIDSITNDTIRHVTHIMDYAFNAKYKVLKNVFNKIETDTINFVVYNHYGRPDFENYENVILYISQNKEKEHYYHQKYQYDAIKKSKNGLWKGLNGKSIDKLFANKRNGIFKDRGLFQ